MRPLLVVTLILFWQSAPVTNNSSGNQNQNDKANQEQKKIGCAAPIVSIGKCSGCFQEQAHGANKEQKGNYDPSSDGLYRWYLKANIAGAVFAFLGILFLLFQSIATANAANAALINAKVSVNAQRAWIRAWLEHAPQSNTHRQLVVINDGNTPAQMRNYALTVYHCVPGAPRLSRTDKRHVPIPDHSWLNKGDDKPIKTFDLVAESVRYWGNSAPSPEETELRLDGWVEYLTVIETGIVKNIESHFSGFSYEWNPNDKSFREKPEFRTYT